MNLPSAVPDPASLVAPDSMQPEAKRRLRTDAEGAMALIRETLGLGRPLWLDASGASMYPVIRDGNRVLLAPRRRPARKGDIVLARFGQRLVLHRVTGVRGPSLTIRGDASVDSDPVVLASQTVGVAIACADDRGVRSLSPTLRYGLAALLRQCAIELHRALRVPLRWGRFPGLARILSARRRP